MPTLISSRSLSGPIPPGTVISLNLNRAPFLAFPGTPLRMSFNNPSAVIPEGLSDETNAAIADAITQGLVVIGDSPIAPKKATTDQLEVVFSRLDRFGDTYDLSRPAVLQAAIAGAVGGPLKLTVYEVVYACLKHELMNRCRTKIVHTLSRALDSIDGPQVVREGIVDKRVSKEMVTRSMLEALESLPKLDV